MNIETIKDSIEEAINERRMEVAVSTIAELRLFDPDDGDGIIDTLRETADKLESLNDVWGRAEDFLDELEDALS